MKKVIQQSRNMTAAKMQAELSSTGKTMQVSDVLIAGTCVNHQTPLLTRDKGFARVSQLKTVSY